MCIYKQIYVDKESLQKFNKEGQEPCQHVDKKNQELKDKQTDSVIIPNSIADICWDTLLHCVNDKVPEKYASDFLK